MNKKVNEQTTQQMFQSKLTMFLALSSATHLSQNIAFVPAFRVN
jgi:hypothetical protein